MVISEMKKWRAYFNLFRIKLKYPCKKYVSHVCEQNILAVNYKSVDIKTRTARDGRQAAVCSCISSMFITEFFAERGLSELTGSVITVNNTTMYI